VTYNVTNLLVAGIFGQSSGGSTFGTVKTQAAISGAFSGGAGSVQSTGFGGFQKQPTSSPGVFFNASPCCYISVFIYSSLSFVLHCVAEKKFTSSASYNFDVHELILIIIC